MGSANTAYSSEHNAAIAWPDTPDPTGTASTDGHLFVSYSRLDGREFALQLTDELLAGPPAYPVWLD